MTRSYLSLLSVHVPALLAGAEDATSPDMSMARIKATLKDDGVTAAQKLFHVLVMNVRGPALAVIRGITDMNGARAWRALVTRYAPSTAPRVQSLMSAILNAKPFPSELTAYEIALDERHENTRKLESISGDRFNVSMKKAIFLDKDFNSANPTSDAKSGHLRSDDSSDSSVYATQCTVSSRCDRTTQQQERVRRHGNQCLDKEM